jgi:glycosyltransferase involved in cell wall biosynthesis
MRRSIDPLRDRAAYAAIRRVIRDFRPDVVHTHAAKAGALGRLAARAENVPVLVHTFHGHVFHSYFGPLKTRFYLEAERYLARRSSRIVAISPGQKRDLVERYRICPPERVTVIPLGFDLDRFAADREANRASFRTTYRLLDHEVAIGIIGRLAPIKNHELFLNVMRRLRESSRTPVRGFVVGDGAIRSRLEDAARSMGLLEGDRPGVTFTSWIHDVERAHAGLDILVLTSLNEGTPVSLIEAQAAGRPVVSTDVGGVRDALLPGESGWIAPSGDAGGLAAHLAKLVEDAALRRAMGEAGAAFVRGRFHRTRLAEEIRSLYRELLQVSARRGGDSVYVPSPVR